MILDQKRLVILGAVLFGLIVLAANTFYVVDQRQQVIVVRFGEPVRVVNAFEMNDPGLKVKAPFLERVQRFDKRNIALAADQEEVIAANQERLVVDAFVRYRINDPLQFFRTLRNDQTAADRIERLVNSSLRQVLGSASSEDIISGRRAELTRATRADVAKRALESRFGITVIDVRIKRADLPPQNQAAVFQRMRTARQQEAAQIRAVGEQQRREIIAGADREVTVTLATANEEAQTTRGVGDARRASIFAQAFGRDAGFANFYRSMQAYDSALGRGDTTMVLSPDSAFFRFFERGPGG